MQYNAAGSGSGFIIDQSGIAVTNNHVVTGAALIRRSTWPARASRATPASWASPSAPTWL